MHKKDIYTRIFFEALRTAFIFLSGFIIYEILLETEKKWNEMEPSHRVYHFHKRNSIKFLFIFVIDVTILYLFHRMDIM
jgi:hypothetical protein